MSSIRKNEELGNISRTDALDLCDLTTKLYMQVYAKYKELGEFTMRLYDQSMELASDKYEKTVEELEDEIKEMKGIIEKHQESLLEKDDIIKKLEQRLKEAQIES